MENSFVIHGLPKGLHLTTDEWTELLEEETTTESAGIESVTILSLAALDEHSFNVRHGDSRDKESNSGSCNNNNNDSISDSGDISCNSNSGCQTPAVAPLMLLVELMLENETQLVVDALAAWLPPRLSKTRLARSAEERKELLEEHPVPPAEGASAAGPTTITTTTATTTTATTATATTATTIAITTTTTTAPAAWSQAHLRIRCLDASMHGRLR
ncbi:unnamed protein product, partial [Polarella glacialis]